MDSTTVLIPGRLAFLCASPTIIQKVKESDVGKSVHMISSDLHRQYSPLALDFGPVNLGVVNRFCAAFSKRLAKQVSHSRLLVYCFEETLEAQANACFLLASLLVLDCGWTAEEAAEPFTGPSSPFTLRPFRDATFSENPYPLLLLDCLKGLSKAVQRGWFDQKTLTLRSTSITTTPTTATYTGSAPSSSPSRARWRRTARSVKAGSWPSPQSTTTRCCWAWE